MHKSSHFYTKTPLGRKVIVVLCGIACGIILLEAGLRLSSYIAASFKERKYRPAISTKKGAFRILCLGESMSLGSYPHNLERILNQRHKGIKYTVITKAAAATDSTYILNHLEQNLNLYKPDIAIVMTGINDRFIKYYEDIPDSGGALFTKSRAYRFLRILWMQLVNKTKQRGTQTAPNVTFPFPPSQDKSVRLSKAGREAEESLKKAIALNPRNDQDYVELGKLSVNLMKFSQAEGYLKKAIALNPHNDQAYFELGRNYIYEARIGEAEESLKKAIALNPRNARTYADLGWCYIIQGMFFDAERLLKKSLALNYRNDETLFELGRLSVGLGKLAEGEKYLKMSLELNPARQEAYGSLAVTYQSMGRGDLADEYYYKADELRTKNSNKKTCLNYLAMKKILGQKNVRLVCVQYPMRSIAPLRKIFEREENIIFVDNEMTFKEAVKKEGYKEYFVDMFGGDFGHCTEKGNRLLAENIAGAILQACSKQ